MTDITQEEYIKTSDGGYMLVNHGEKSPMSPTVDTADLSNRIVTQPPAEKIDFEEEKTIDQLSKEQLMHKVDESISDTILPSKSPLQPNDPMNFLLEKRFLTTFLFASTALVLMMSLFD